METADYQRLPKMSIFGHFCTKTFPSSKNSPFLEAKTQNFLDKSEQSTNQSNIVHSTNEKKASCLIIKLLASKESRDYWTRTSDLAPPRRVRYQLR